MAYAGCVRWALCKGHRWRKRYRRWTEGCWLRLSGAIVCWYALAATVRMGEERYVQVAGQYFSARHRDLVSKAKPWPRVLGVLGSTDSGD